MSKYTHTDLDQTIVALSTPQGIGAIGLVRLSGKAAIAICDQVFRGKKLANQASHTVHYGTLYNKDILIDEVMVAIFKSPRSYTTENMVEVSCHGSPYILQKAIEAFIQHGARLAKPGEFTLRAFLNGRIDLSQAEAVADLIASESEASHTMALQQMRGGFSDQISKLREELIHFASMIELELDFSEEDVEFADRDDLRDLVTNIQYLIQQLRDSFMLGNAIKHGVTSVIAGRPNAGKSTLLNAILNEERAIVSAIAGTTRDTIEEVVNINGIQFRMIDTAGIRDARDQIEAIGVQKTMEKIEQSSVLIYVFDATEFDVQTVSKDLKKIDHKGLPVLVVANKIDALSPTQLKTVRHQGQSYFRDRFLMLSAVQKQNIDLLKERLYQSVITTELTMENTIVTNIRHFEALDKSHQALKEVLDGVEMCQSGEILSLDIRSALHYLGEITGEVTTDDLLGNIFSKFCIGK